jgi:hypothetical protein
VIPALGRTLQRWQTAFLGTFAVGASNGGTEALGLIGLRRGLAEERPMAVFRSPRTRQS